MSEDYSNLLDMKQVVTRVNLTQSYLYERMRQGTFPKGRKFGHARMWTLEEIEAWERERGNINNEA